MKATIKNIVGRTYKPFLEKYLSKKRIYTYGNIRLEVPPEVFHPGFFTSTQFLLQYLKELELNGRNFLELGAGNGLISMYVAKQKVNVTATDINLVAIEYLQKNSKANNIEFNIIHSDMFDNVPAQQFDIIAINPPYYKKDPRSLLDHAWYCGENGEFFLKLFQQLPGYINSNSKIIMVLCDGCDLNLIEKAAENNGFKLVCLKTKQSLIEKTFLYEIKKLA